jgi:hypothetical protein
VYNFTYGADGALKMDLALKGVKGGRKNPALLKGSKVICTNISLNYLSWNAPSNVIQNGQNSNPRS